MSELTDKLDQYLSKKEADQNNKAVVEESVKHLQEEIAVMRSALVTVSELAHHAEALVGSNGSDP